MDSGNLKYQYSRLNIAEKLIAINLGIYIVDLLFTFLMNWNRNTFVQWFELPADFFEFLSQPWSVVTYSFFHAGFGHLFWNMIILYFTGRIFLNLFGPRTFINVYFLGIILGGLLFLLSYNVFPAFMGTRTALIGASAGVTAVLIFICTYMPNQEVRLIFFNIKLWYIGAFVVLMDLIQIASSNSGGRIAHLGGALLGYVFARQLLQGRDIGKGFSAFLDSLASLFKKGEKKAPMKTVYRKKKASTKSKVNYEKENRQRKIDSILDKISKSGYESLSQAEKDFLFKAGKE
ncbi:MAG: rhomboid family intramembrane serine protease [Eudoraea sp.]|nr:rhomboid family intramembrane serine protease [Eudoraea sp.]MBT8223364.1 rhomboid family intramembrane serine protease [Eudoraea sp.]NNK30929.1 rhomboid family intramembrane serine protease [Flavobacteriaceae bacterium]